MTIIAPASPYPTIGQTRPEYRQPRITPRQRRQQEHAMRHFTRPVDPAQAQALQGRLDAATQPRPRREVVAFDRQHT